jgi:hypothetical protein
MNDITKIGSDTTQSVEAEMRIQYNSCNSIALGVAAIRDLVVYAIHHYSTVRQAAFQALVACGYVEEILPKPDSRRARHTSDR